MLAPGYAEAALCAALGLLAGAIAVIGHRHLNARLDAVGEAAPATARDAPSSSHPARAIA
jgi:biopolymer transport protein ExbB/TolQ